MERLMLSARAVLKICEPYSHLKEAAIMQRRQK